MIEMLGTCACIWSCQHTVPSLNLFFPSRFLGSDVLEWISKDQAITHEVNTDWTFPSFHAGFLTCPNWSSYVGGREMTSELWHSLHLIRIPPFPIIFKYRHLHTTDFYSLPTFPHVMQLLFIITLILMTVKEKRQQSQLKTTNILSARVL